jgi:hypothetical protein
MLLKSSVKNENAKVMKATQEKTKLPVAGDFVSSPLRNRIILELDAPLKDVWYLVGDPGKMPQYSEGLQSVETKQDEYGNCTEYLCHFKPTAPGEKGIDHRAIVIWYEPLMGWASKDEEPNLFGLTESLTLLTLSDDNDRTTLQWDMHFYAEDVEMNKDSLEQVLNDISKRLIDRFGGRMIESFVEGKNPQ